VKSVIPFALLLLCAGALALAPCAALEEGAGWSASQACGPPNSPERGGDSDTAWEARRPQEGVVWLELAFAEARHATGLRIVQCSVGGCVCRVALFDEEGARHVVWEGDSVSKAPTDLTLEFERTSFATRRARIYVDTCRAPGWKEIDAVELLAEEGAQWAEAARCTSSYAEQRGSFLQAGVALHSVAQSDEEGGTLALAAPAFQLTLSSDEGRVSVLGKEGKAKLPAGWYGLNGLALRRTDEAGRLWVIESCPAAPNSEFTLPAGGELALPYGEPLRANVEGVQRRGNAIEVGFSLTGAGGETYDAAGLRIGRESAQPPGVRIVEKGTEKVIATGRFRYG
jgi:hypothetical protein